MKTKIILGYALLSLGLSSCSDFLQEDPKGQLTPSTFYASQEELDMSIYSLYSIAAEGIRENITIAYHCQGDDMCANPGSNKLQLYEFDTFSPKDNNACVSNCWNKWYKLIKQANFIINNVGRVPTSQLEIDIAMGQAKFWRAWAYFNLVRLYGNVPKIVTDEIDYTIQPSSITEIYDLITSDLESIDNTLPASYENYGAPRFINGTNNYVTAQAVKSLLSAVYMAKAGWPLKQTENYAKAADKAKEVIDGVNNGTYDVVLENDWSKIYAPSNNYSKETLMGMSFTNAFGAWSQDSWMINCNLFESLGGWGDYWGEIKFWQNMPDGPRKDAIYNKKILVNNGRKGETELINWWDVVEKHPMFRVFTVAPGDQDYDYTQPASMDACNAHRHRLIRYSEVLLWYAEAQARSEGTPNAFAYECIDQVRKRAGLEPLPRNLSGTEFANAALQEHGWEIAGYTSAVVTRRADMLRMELLETYFNERLKNEPIRITPEVVVEEVKLTGNWNGEKSIYAPYPEGDASLNPNLK